MFSHPYSVPAVPFDEESSFALDSTNSKPNITRTPKYHAHLDHYVHHLTIKPNEPPYDLTTTDLELKPTTLPSSTSLQSIASIQNATPESDSFTYLEHVLESLAVLNKLSVSLDAVSQRLPIEIYNLVEITISEVSERLEGSFRSSLLPLFDGGRPSSVYMFAEAAPQANGVDAMKGASGLRLTVLEQMVKEKNREILRDLFWTLYSKLDAVVQGLKVVSEVSNRIASVRIHLKCTFDSSTDISKRDGALKRVLIPRPGHSFLWINSGYPFRPRFEASSMITW
jgi:exocyst complex component 4